MKGENSDVPKFQYKVTVLFHQKLKMFTENCYIILSFYTHTHTQYIYIYICIGKNIEISIYFYRYICILNVYYAYIIECMYLTFVKRLKKAYVEIF